MSSTTRAPMPSYPGTILPIHDHPAWKHLSGTTMDTTNFKQPIVHPIVEPIVQPALKSALKPIPNSTVKPTLNPTVQPEKPVSTAEPDVTDKEAVVYLPVGNTTLNRFSDITMSTRRASYASTTKSQLRQSNQHLFEMIQSLQAELATHRAIMLDVQSRLSFLEQDAPTMVEDNEPSVLSPSADELKPPQRPPPPPPRRASSLIPPGRESQSWWQACQNFAENCDTPFNAQEFLGTPSHFEDFDFHFGGLATGEEVQPPSTIDIEEPAEVSPPSECQSSEHIESRSPSIFSEEAPRTSGLTMDNCEELDSIIEQVVEFRKPAVLPPLLLHPPPSGRTASILSVEEITALPNLPLVTEVSNDPQRHRKSIRSISTKWASLKGKSMDQSDFRKGFFSMR